VVHISAHCDHSKDAEPVTCETYLDILTSGAEYAEFDIRRTADNVLVVHHDGCAGRGGPLVADLEYQELCDRLHYAVPRVDEVMALLTGRLIGHLDLKETGYEETVVALASSILGPGNFVVTTLEDASVAAIKRAFPDVRTALSLGRSLRGVPRRRWAAVRHSELFPLSRIRACGADWVAVNYRLARLGVARMCHRNGIGIMVWTVDDGALIDQFLVDERIDVLITNRPGHAACRRSELGLGAAGQPARSARLGGMPVAGEHAQDDQVGESPVDPGRTAQAAFRRESGPGRHRDHRGVVGQRLRLEPLQPEYGEAVTAEHADGVRPQAAATEPRPQRDPQMGRAVMPVDAPDQGVTSQFATGQVHHREDRAVLSRVFHPVGGVGLAGRDRPPGPRIGPDLGRHIVIPLAVQDRDISVFPGPQPGYFPAQHAMFLPDGSPGRQAD